MKSILIRVFYILLIAVLGAKLLDIFLDFDPEVNRWITTAMFCLLGIGYLRYAFLETKRVFQILFALCGLYLIAMNFIERNDVLTAIGVICLLIPLIFRRINRKKKQTPD